MHSTGQPVDEIDAAARLYPGPLLVIGGPGTGKTECLARRIRWLVVEKSISPENITVITFTFEATRNMKSRISDPSNGPAYVEPSKQPKRISTMHSLGLEIIRNHHGELGLKEGFKVQTLDVLREVLFGDAAQLAGFPRDFGRQVMMKKVFGDTGMLNENESSVLAEYDRIMRASGAIDYDDQILLACKLLESKSEVLHEYQEKSTFLLVDEYQDINASQFRLIQLLCGGNVEGLFVVGDDDQSIYSFRGGSPKFIREFAKDYGERATVIKLQTSKRCAETIIKGAYAVVRQFNKDRLEKPDLSFADSRRGEIVLHDAPDQEGEARDIVRAISNFPPGSEIMILVPSRGFSEPIKRALLRERIGFDCKMVIELEGFRTIDAVREWLEDENDNFAFRLVMQAVVDSGSCNVPSVRVKKQEKKDARNRALENIAKLWKGVIKEGKKLSETLGLASKEKGSLAEIVMNSVNEIRNASSGELSVFLEVLGRTTRPWANPKRFLEVSKTALDEVEGRKGAGGGPNVRILSMRLAKGLEADIVYVIGLEKGIFPKGEPQTEQAREESRLFFVAMTRAKEQLHLYHCRKRTSDITHVNPSYRLPKSPFISAIPRELLKTSGVPRKGKRK